MSELGIPSPNESKLSTDITDLRAKKAREEEKKSLLVSPAILGHPCDRFIWLAYRWACWLPISGQTERRKDSEGKEFKGVLKDLEALGLTIKNTDKGLIATGVPEAPATEHLLMFELLSDASFQVLHSKGLKEALPMSYTTLQCQLHGVADRALYIAENGNTSELVAYRVRLDEGFASRQEERICEIISSPKIPQKISESDEEKVCKECDYYTFCHFWKRPEVHCRTCSHFYAERNGVGRCSLFDKMEIPYETQIKGCDCHIMRPDLVDWELDLSRSTEYVGGYYIPDLKKTLFNGYGGVKTADIMKEIWQHGVKRVSEEDSSISF